MSRVLVTGATGFIGRRALGPLLEAGHEVHAVSTRPPPGGAPVGVIWHQSDLLADPGEIVGSVAPQRLLHLAWYAEHGRFWTAPENVAWVEATLTLVRRFAAAGGERAVVAGSCAEYDWDHGGRCVEGSTPLAPAALYGSAKNATREVLEAASEQLGVAVAWGRVFFLYGPGEDERRLVASVTRALLAGERARTTAGAQVRDFLHVDDVAGAFAALLAGEVTGAVNIGSGEGTPVSEMVWQIARATGRRDLLDVGALPDRAGEPAAIVADVRRLCEEAGFTPAIGLEQGIDATVRWWRAARA